jgi:hypothetical protein
MSAVANAGSSFLGWMQSTGQTSTQAVSLVPMQGSQMIYAITLILLVLSRLAGAPAPGGPAAQDDSTSAGSCDPRLASLFAPAQPHWGRYEVCTSPRSLDRVASEGFTCTSVEFLEALDAFGAAGSYSRAALAQLYRGRRVAVVRGWRDRAARFESVTLLTPYPDPSLSHLEQGTMIIRWIVER